MMKKVKTNKKVKKVKKIRVANQRHQTTSEYNNRTIPMIAIHNHIYQTKKMDSRAFVPPTQKFVPPTQKNVYSKAMGVDAETQTEISENEGKKIKIVVKRKKKTADETVADETVPVADGTVETVPVADETNSVAVVSIEGYQIRIEERARLVAEDNKSKQYTLEQLNFFTVPHLKGMLIERGIKPGSKNNKNALKEKMLDFFANI